MGIKIEEEWHYKKVRSERASKSAFAYKVNRKLKESNKVSYGYRIKAALSREVIVKITGGAWSKKGIKNAVEYISKEWQEEITDSNGISYKTKEETEKAVEILQANTILQDPAKKVKLTHNITFSAPRIAEVKKEELFAAVKKALNEKYPDNYFAMSYHVDTKNPHVHVVLNIHKNTGQRIDIRKKDLRNMRENFCKNLVEFGYDVKATRRYGLKTQEYTELLSRENKNIYEVVDYGKNLYQLDDKNSKNNYLTYRVINSGKEVTIWGKELNCENLKKGDLIKIKKVGEIEVKVPVYGNDGKTIESWKKAKRNQWNVEKINDNTIKIGLDYPKEIKLDTPEQAAKQLQQKQKFEHEKKLYLNPLYKEKYELEQKMQHKQKYNLNF